MARRMGSASVPGRGMVPILALLAVLAGGGDAGCSPAGDRLLVCACAGRLVTLIWP